MPELHEGFENAIGAGILHTSSLENLGKKLRCELIGALSHVAVSPFVAICDDR